MSAVLSWRISKDRINRHYYKKVRIINCPCLYPVQTHRCPHPWQDGVTGFCSQLRGFVQKSGSPGEACPCRSVPFSPSMAQCLTNLLIWSGDSLGQPVGRLVPEQAVGSSAQPPCKGAIASVGSNRWVEDPFSHRQRAITNELFPWAIPTCRSCPHSAGWKLPYSAKQEDSCPLWFPSAPTELHKPRLCRYLKLFPLPLPFHSDGQVGAVYHPASSPAAPVDPPEPAPTRSLPCVVDSKMQEPPSRRLQKQGQSPLHTGSSP